MKKFLLPSLILALISTIPFLLFKNSETGEISMYISLSSYLLLLLTFLFAVRRYKLIYSGGVIAFGKAFKYAFKVTLCHALIVSVVFFIYAKFNESSLMTQMTNQMNVVQEQQVATQGYVSANYEKTMSTVVSLYCNPFVLSGMTFLSTLIWGAIFSIISAAIVKSKPED